MCQAAVPRVGDARNDWSIVRALSEVLEKPLPYNTTDEVRARLADVAPHFALVDTVQSPMWLNGEYFKVRAPRGWHCSTLVGAAMEFVSIMPGGCCLPLADHHTASILKGTILQWSVELCCPLGTV